jgi:hypothetical protein
MCVCAHRFGAYSLLLDRFGTQKAAQWRSEGVTVLQDLMDVVAALSRAEGMKEAAEQSHSLGRRNLSA